MSILQILRLIVLWISGIGGSFLIGASTGVLLCEAVEADNLNGFFIGIGAALAFVCARLWAMDVRQSKA